MTNLIPEIAKMLGVELDLLTVMITMRTARTVAEKLWVIRSEQNDC